MYRFSRSIYRDLAPYVLADPVNERSAHTQANGDGRSNSHVNGSGKVNGNRSVNGHANGHAHGAAHANGNGHRDGHGGARGHADTNGQQLLDACEAAMRRLAYDRRYFAHPARSLFGEVRMYFPIHEQVRAFRVIERNVDLALEHLARLPEQGLGLDGQPSECRAHTRKGLPCQRQPLPGRDYCPSHKHLEESLEPAAETKLLDERAGVPQGPVSAAT